MTLCVVPTDDTQRTISLSAGYILRCWTVLVRNECMPGMSPDSFEWICIKLRVRADQGLTKTLEFPAQQKSFFKEKKKPSLQLRIQDDGG